MTRISKHSSKKQAKKLTSFQIALTVVKRLKRAGFQAYFAGGCVRDKLMKFKPMDYDVATDAKPNQVIKLFKKTITTGKVFGVINVIEKGGSARSPRARPEPAEGKGIQVEVTTFRTEGPYTDGRHPDKVKFSSLEADVLRRDFTINGMLYDPVKRKLIDLVKGKQDLRKKTIRAIGNPLERFREDKLRMMRAIRFACELGFKIEPKTFAAIKKLHRQITVVSVERIREELKRILISPRRSRGIELLDETGLLKRILPEVSRLKGVQQPKEFHPEGDVYVHTIRTLKHLKHPSWELVFASLLHDIGKPDTFMITDRIRFHEHERVGRDMAQEICERFKLSNAEKEKVMWLVDRHMAFKDIQKMRTSTMKRLFRQPYYPELAELHRADRLASDLDLKPHYYARRMYKKLSKEDLKPKLLIDGYDLIKLGLKPGPIFGEILKKVEETQLENKITTKRQALQLARRINQRK